MSKYPTAAVRNTSYNRSFGLVDFQTPRANVPSTPKPYDFRQPKPANENSPRPANDNIPGGKRMNSRELTRFITRIRKYYIWKQYQDTVVEPLTDVVQLGLHFAHVGFRPSFRCKASPGNFIIASWNFVCPHKYYTATGAPASNASFYAEVNRTGRIHSVYGWPEYDQIAIYQRLTGATQAVPTTRRMGEVSRPHLYPYRYPAVDPMVIPLHRNVPVPEPLPWEVIPYRPNVAVEGTVRGPRISNPGRRKPPGEGKERKFYSKSKKLALLLQRLMHSYTEGLDFLNALWDAMPDHIKNRKGLTPGQKAELIYKHFNEMDLQQAVLNLIANHLVDAVLGRMMKAAKTEAERRDILLWGLTNIGNI